MARIAILDDYQNVARSMADWSRLERQHSLTFFDKPIKGIEALTTTLAPFEVIGLMRERTPFQRALIERLPNLRLLVTTGMRNASIDMQAAAERRVTVCGTPAGNHATAELTLAIMLGLSRNLHIELANMREGRWQTTIGLELRGKTLGLLGLGKLGSEVARLGQAFGMTTIAWSQNLTAADAAGKRVERVEKDELFRRSDFLSIHLVLSERSRGLVGARELGLMKPTAFLINTSRGPIVDADALSEALRSGRLAGAGLDVYGEEPLPSDHPLRREPRALLTPHLGYVTAETYRTFYPAMVRAIEAFLDGKPVQVIG
jgi:phosphoglycerate dehydrogenase-like enzyme